MSLILLKGQLCTYIYMNNIYIYIILYIFYIMYNLYIHTHIYVFIHLKQNPCEDYIK